jgi:rare lipoprotein A
LAKFEPAMGLSKFRMEPLKLFETDVTFIGLAVASILIVTLASTATAAQQWQAESGIAATYSDKSGKTTSGEAFNPQNMTAAHRSLPFGTMVRVTNTQNGRSTVVRINDRGPFTRGRVIDVTPAAARALGFSGLAPVKLSLAAPDG